MNVRSWLQEKAERGVKDVRVASVLAQLDSAEEVVVGDASSGAAQQAAKTEVLPDGRLLVVEPGVLSLSLVGTAEAADDILKVERPRIGRWRKQFCTVCQGERPTKNTPKPAKACSCKPKDHDHWAPSIMPPPLGELASGPVWERSQIVAMKGVREERRRGPKSRKARAAARAAAAA